MTPSAFWNFFPFLECSVDLTKFVTLASHLDDSHLSQEIAGNLRIGED